MASTRYGRIQHDRYSAINVKFPSPDARQEFADKFNEYHASHDHDGEVPTFELITAADTKGYTGGRRPVELEDISIDGYTHTELIEYHEENGLYRNAFYRPPTCCVAPIISLDREFVVADTLERHELSAIFGDMPTDDYQSLLSSVEKDGFMDQHIKILDGKVLDGWHRYRAGRELNLLRKLKFQQWNEKDDGDPQAFVLARNIERRHLGASQRAQIIVTFNERFGLGDNQHTKEGTPNGEPKTREELAKEAGVGTSTIDRAVIIEKEGESEAVIAGEKTAGEVIKARDAAKLKKHKQSILKNMWDTNIQAARDYTGDSDTDLNQYLSLDDLEKGFAEHNESFADAFTSGMKRIDTAASFKNFQDRAFEVDEHGVAKVSIDDLEKENRAIGFYAGDIRQWQRPDWSPDTNWILPLIEAKKVERGHIAPRPEPKPEPDLETLREQVKSEMPKWKQRYKETGKKESELVSRASFSALIHVLRHWDEASSTPPEEGAATAEELEELLKHLKDDGYAFIFRLRRYIKETEQPVPDETLPFVPEDADEDAETEVSEPESDPTFDAAVEDALDSLNSMWDSYDRSEELKDVSRSDFAVAAAKHNGLYVENDYGSGENYLMQRDFALLKNLSKVAEVETWKHRFNSISVDIEMRADWVEALVAECDAPEPEVDEDTSLTEIDNLLEVKQFLESLNSQVETYIDRIQRDEFSLRVFDALHFDALEENSELTERQQLAILMDVAYSILVESDSTSF
ncbi:MAG: hypothetical protein OXN27_25685 [Candidatus Poribacteria bacterium]|nr:hypothetical protein [Candidatus Poribacteria bacterium]